LNGDNGADPRVRLGSESRSGLGLPMETVAKLEAVAVAKLVTVAVARGDLVKPSTSRQVSLSIFLRQSILTITDGCQTHLPPIAVVGWSTVSSVEPRN
jgi:hypothetical protein